jgi:hypothetical protein
MEMNTKRSELELVQKKYQEVEEQMGSLSRVSAELQQKQREIKRQIVLEEKMLNEAKWILCIASPTDDGRKSTFWLESNKRDEPRSAVELCYDWDHWSFALSDNWKDVSLRGDDGQISLRFDSDEMGLEFIRSQDLDVDVSQCRECLERLSKSKEAYEKLLEMFEK